jgi:chemotaxis protein MotB
MTDTSFRLSKEFAQDDQAPAENLSPVPIAPVVPVKNADEESASPLWLITFADIMALCLTFFVMMYATSNPQQEQWDKIAKSLKSSFSQYQGARHNGGQEGAVQLSGRSNNQALNLNYVRSLLQQAQKADPALSGMKMRLLAGQLVISLPADMLFEATQAKISTAGQKVLFSLGGVLSRLKNRIEIVGQADPRPIPEGGLYQHNWELSLARAAEVAAGLYNAGYVADLQIRGYSSGAYEAVSDAVPEAERMKLARRVDIVVLPDDGKQRGFLHIGN